MTKKEWIIIYLSIPSGGGKRKKEDIKENPIPLYNITFALFFLKLKFKDKLKNFYCFYFSPIGLISYELYRDLIDLEKRNIIENCSNYFLYKGNCYKLTSKGEKKAQKSINKIQNDFFNYLKKIKIKISKLSIIKLYELINKYKKRKKFKKILEGNSF